MNKKVNDLVITVETAKKLKAAGVIEESVYGYFKNDTDNYHLFEQDDHQTGLAAYTSGELADLLPDSLEVDSSTFRATTTGWTQISFDKGNYPSAHLHTIKTGLNYMSGYYYGGTMIAFSKSASGIYNNLLLNGETEQEARACLLLELISEGKFQVTSDSLLKKLIYGIRYSDN